MRAIMIVSALLVFLPAMVLGQEERIFPFEYRTEALANGLRVIAVPLAYPDLVTFFSIVHAGARNEIEPGRTGFAHFFEHMMFRGTKAYPEEKYNALLKGMGADSNGYTTEDYTAYYLTFVNTYLDQIVQMEADRFKNLMYSVEDLKTEAGAIQGEYNRIVFNPFFKAEEALRLTAFSRHPYRHSAIGFLEDIQDMPNQYDYSLRFFRRYYRPENVDILVVGDFDPDRLFELIRQHYADWEVPPVQVPPVPQEPAQEEPHQDRVVYQGQTLPILAVAHKGPAYSDTELAMAAMDVISELAFSSSSPLYQRLVLEEQKVDYLTTDFSDQVDPGLLTIYARIKQEEDIDDVQSQILATLEDLKGGTVEADRLERVKSHLRYQLAMRLDSTTSVAGLLAHYVNLRRDPATINHLYDLYASLTPEDIQREAQRYFAPERRTAVTVIGEK